MGSGKLVIMAYGGSYREGIVRALVAPFVAEYGTDVTVLEANNIDVFTQCRSQVMSGSPAWDVTVTNQAYFRRGIQEGLWEPIDYEVFQDQSRDTLPLDMWSPYGVPAAIYSNNLVLSARALPTGKPRPKSWADFWDVDRFPGRRALPVCDSGINPLPEIACLADGVPAKDLYPIDMPRAARKLAQLAPHIVWWRTGGESVSLLVGGRAAAGLLGNGRAQAAIDSGAELEIVWRDARRTFDVWYVLRGASNRREAMRFLAFIQRAQAQADFARMTGLSPTNPAAYDLLEENTRRKLTTYPPNHAETFANNEAWWLTNRDAWVELCAATFSNRSDPRQVSDEP